jgi:FkbM family methyltransferase
MPLFAAARYRVLDPKYLFRRYLPEDAVIVEAGACTGTETQVLARDWPHGRIHAFEPVPEMYKQLESNTAGLANVSIYPHALGDRDGEAVMWIGGPSSSLLEPKGHLNAYPGVSFDDDPARVEATTLASWAARHGIDRVDGIWLDLQGSELVALRAAGGVLETTRAIVLEASKVELYAGGPRWAEVRAWLREHGFRVRGWRWDATGNHGDVLVVRKVKPAVS